MSTKKLQIIDSLVLQAENANTLDGKTASEFASASDVEQLQILVGDTSVAEQISEATTEVDVKLEQKFDKITLTTIFDENFNILATTDVDTISSDFAANYINDVKYAFITSGVTTIEAGAFTDCVSLADVFIDNVIDGVELVYIFGASGITSTPFPSSTELHYVNGVNTLQGILARLCNKADKEDVYTKNEIDQKLDQKANEDEVYTVAEASGRFLSSIEPGGSVGFNHIRDGAVTTEKVADSSITFSKLADDAKMFLADLTQIQPCFANLVDECSDTSKVYVLPDGYIYAYMKSTGVLYTDLVDPSSEDWKLGYRINGSGVLVTTNANVLTTPYIPVKQGDILRVKGLNLFSEYISGYACTAIAYDENKAEIARIQPSINYADNSDIVVAMINGNATVKRFYKEDSHIRLQPENPTMQPIYCFSVDILGKVVGLIRHY
jgi:hypothetical protein